MVISYEVYETSLHRVSYEMTMSVRFCLPYDCFELNFIVFKVDIAHNVVTDVIMMLHVRAKMLRNVVIIFS